MRAHQIFQSMSPQLGGEILGFFRDQEKKAYNTALASLAQQRRLRPVFVQKKPRDQQIAWLLSNLALKTNDQLGEHLLQVWLMRAQSPMLVSFLDAMKIEHDGEGAVDDLPESLDAAELAKAVDALLATYPAELVGVYLETFQLQRPGGWEELSAELERRGLLTSSGESGAVASTES